MVRYERPGAAALITIDRPERRNAIDGPTAEALHDAFRRFVADDEARVLVLSRRGRGGVLRRRRPQGLETLGPRLDRPEGPLGFTRMASPKPTIAAISGWCLAGGFELALWCDLRVATPSARFGFTERRFGVPLIDGGTQRLPRIVGSGRALDLVLSGRIVEADEASAIGLAHRGRRRPGRTSSARWRWPSGWPRSPRTRCSPTAGRCSRARACRSSKGLALEAQLGRGRHGIALEGAERFAGGEGRHGEGTGI